MRRSPVSRAMPRSPPPRPRLGAGITEWICSNSSGIVLFVWCRSDDMSWLLIIFQPLIWRCFTIHVWGFVNQESTLKILSSRCFVGLDWQVSTCAGWMRTSHQGLQPCLWPVDHDPNRTDGVWPGEPWRTQRSESEGTYRAKWMISWSVSVSVVILFKSTGGSRNVNSFGTRTANLFGVSTCVNTPLQSRAVHRRELLRYFQWTGKPGHFVSCRKTYRQDRVRWEWWDGPSLIPCEAEREKRDVRAHICQSPCRWCPLKYSLL